MAISISDPGQNSAPWAWHHPTDAKQRWRHLVITMGVFREWSHVADAAVTMWRMSQVTVAYMFQ